jgi:hypothetical protein
VSSETQLTDAELRRRQRVRNLVMLIVLLGLAALFYAIAVVRFRVS